MADEQVLDAEPVVEPVPETKPEKPTLDTCIREAKTAKANLQQCKEAAEAANAAYAQARADFDMWLDKMTESMTESMV